MPSPLLILNPDAGGIRGDPRILSSLQTHPVTREVEVAAAGGADEVRALARKSREEGRSQLLVGGGVPGIPPASLSKKWIECVGFWHFPWIWAPTLEEAGKR